MPPPAYHLRSFVKATRLIALAVKKTDEMRSVQSLKEGCVLSISSHSVSWSRDLEGGPRWGEAEMSFHLDLSHTGGGVATTRRFLHFRFFEWIKWRCVVDTERFGGAAVWDSVTWVCAVTLPLPVLMLS